MMRFAAFGLVLTLFTIPLRGEAQPAKVAKIGFLTPPTPAGAVVLVEALRQGLRDIGHIAGKTFVLEVRYGEGKSERLPELARELVGLKVDVIVTTADVATAAATRATRTIPIVMAVSTDPIGTGFVASLARPGRNVTGMSSMSSELSGKRLGLLRDVVPGLSRVAVLWNPDVRGAILEYKETEAAARSLRVELQSVEFSRSEEIERAFLAVTSQRAQALILGADPVTFAKAGQVASFAQRNRLPSMYALKEYVDAGGLMSYGPSLVDMSRRSATDVDKILKGARPGDLPVEQPTKFELVINLKTAKALGLTMPQSLLQRADQVIQ